MIDDEDECVENYYDGGNVNFNDIKRKDDHERDRKRGCGNKTDFEMPLGFLIYRELEPRSSQVNAARNSPV